MAIAYVGGANHGNGATSSNSAAVTYSPAAGNTLCVAFGINEGGATTGTVSCSDNAGGGSSVYSSPTGFFLAGSTFSFAVFYCLSVKSGVTTITATNSHASTAFNTALVDEFSGVGSFDVIGAVNSQVSILPGTNAVLSGAATVTAGDLLWGATVDITGNGGITKQSTFTQAQSITNAYMTEYLIGAAGGSTTVAFTNGATDSFLTGMLSFKPVASGGGGSCSSAKLFGFGCGIALAKSIERNPIIRRRELIIPLSKRSFE